MFKSKCLKHRNESHGTTPDLLGYLESTGLVCGVNVDLSGGLLPPTGDLKRFLGLDVEERNLGNFFDLVPPEEQSRFAALMTQTLRMGAPKDTAIDLLIGHAKASRLVPTQIVFVPPSLLTLNPVHSEAFLRLLLMKRFDPQALSTTDLQNHKLFNLGTLAAGIAHDLNNLFTGMGAFTSLLSHRLHEPRLKKYVAAVEDTLEKATGLTQTILDSLKNDQKDGTLVDPVKCLNDITYLAKRTIDEGIHFAVNLPTANYPVHIKRSELSQVVLNLVVNAKEAVQGHGAISLKAYYLPENQPQFLCIQVQDSGEGISPDDHSRIFDPFFTTKGELGGTGLGLAVVHKIVTQAEGSISVESAPGEGTRFSIQIPLVPPVTD